MTDAPKPPCRRCRQSDERVSPHSYVHEYEDDCLRALGAMVIALTKAVQELAKR